MIAARILHGFTCPPQACRAVPTKMFHVQGGQPGVSVSSCFAQIQHEMACNAEVLGVRRATMSDLVNEKAALSPELVMRVEKAFGVNMDTLLRMQAWHDGYTMRQHAGEIDVKKFTPPAGPPCRNARFEWIVLRPPFSSVIRPFRIGLCGLGLFALHCSV
jgi:plasmid maintenance system antidote protein VapI